MNLPNIYEKLVPEGFNRKRRTSADNTEKSEYFKSLLEMDELDINEFRKKTASVEKSFCKSAIFSFRNELIKIGKESNFGSI